MKKEEVITFKVGPDLLERLQSLPNRSDFIRTAILAALKNSCPLCNGTGHLSPHQKDRWQEFAQHHPLEECEECHGQHLVCLA